MRFIRTHRRLSISLSVSLFSVGSLFLPSSFCIPSKLTYKRSEICDQEVRCLVQFMFCLKKLNFSPYNFENGPNCWTKWCWGLHSPTDTRNLHSTVWIGERMRRIKFSTPRSGINHVQFLMSNDSSWLYCLRCMARSLYTACSPSGCMFSENIWFSIRDPSWDSEFKKTITITVGYDHRFYCSTMNWKPIKRQKHKNLNP